MQDRVQCGESEDNFKQRVGESCKPHRAIAILIPTLNEVDGIGRTIDDILEHVSNPDILVIDSYSTDGTREIVQEKGVTVLDAPRGGKGVAVRSVLYKILREHDYIIMLDGDYTYPARHITEVVATLVDGADVVMGYRATREPGAMTRTNIVGNWILSAIASLLYQIRVHDVCTGLWGFRREALKKLTIVGDRFTLEADLFTGAMRNRCRVEQIPIGYRARLGGSTPKLKVRDGLSIGWSLIWNRMIK